MSVLFYLLLFAAPIVTNTARKLPPKSNIHPLMYTISLKTLFTTNHIDGSVSIDFHLLEESNNLTLHIENVLIPLKSLKIMDDKNNTLKVTNVVYNSTFGSVSADLEQPLKKDVIYNWYSEIVGHDEQNTQGFYLEKYDRNDPPKAIATCEHYFVKLIRLSRKKQFFGFSNMKQNRARAAFPCIDDPYLRTPFKFEIIRPVGYTSVSSGKKSLTRFISNGIRKDEYEVTFPISPDQFGFVVGNFITKTVSIHSLHFSDSSKAELVNAFLTDAMEIMEKLENIFRIKFPPGKLDYVAVPDRLHEHQYIGMDVRGTGMLGLITYKENNALYARANGSFGIAKEKMLLMIWSVAQQWLGNLVRVANIRNKWCKESFALYLSYRILEDLHPSWKVNELFIVEVTQKALTSFPEHLTDYPKTKANEDVLLAKGAALIAMSREMLKDVDFDNALPKVLGRKMHSTMSFQNFFDIIEENLSFTTVRIMNGNEHLKNIIGKWFKADSYPVVTISKWYDRKSKTILVSLEQFRYALDGSQDEHYIWPIHITYVNQGKNFKTPRTNLWLNSSYEVMSCQNLNACNYNWSILNINTKGLFRVNYDNPTWLAIIRSLKKSNHENIPPATRAQLIDDAFNLARAGYINYFIPFHLAQYLKDETSYAPWASYLRNLEFLETMVLKEQWHEHHFIPSILHMLESAAFNVTTLAINNTDPLLEQLQNDLKRWACKYGSEFWIAEANQRMQQWKEEKTDQTPERLSKFLECAMRYASEEDWQFVYKLYFAQRGMKVDYLLDLYRNALASTYDADALKFLLEQAYGDKEEFEKVFKAIVKSGAYAKEFLLQYILINMNELEEIIGCKKAFILVTKGVLSEMQRKKVIRYLKTTSPTNPDVFRSIEIAVEECHNWSPDRNVEIYNFITGKITLDKIWAMMESWSEYWITFTHWDFLIWGMVYSFLLVGGLLLLRGAGVLHANIALPILPLLVAFGLFSVYEAAFVESINNFRPQWVKPASHEFFSQLPRNLRPVSYEIFSFPNMKKLFLRGNITMRFEVLEETNIITVNVCDLKITKVSVIGPYGKSQIVFVQSNKEAETYTITMMQNLVNGSSYTLKMTYEGRLRNDGTGFYWGRYIEDGEAKFFATTNFQPTYARRAFPCMDEPIFKATFLIHIIVPYGYTALSNTNQTHSEYLEEGDRQHFQFDQSPAMSTYNVAMVVCKFANYRINDKKYRIYGRNNFIYDNWGTLALDNIESIVTDIEAYFNNSYVITEGRTKLDLVGIPDEYLPFGAASNWGLLLIKESSLFSKENMTRTDEVLQIMMTLTHGVVHQWFGNLVTYSSKEYFWLHEGLTTFFQLFFLSELNPSWRMMDQFVVKILQPAMIMDSISNGSLIKIDSKDSYNKHSPRHWTEYLKAASVIRMMYHILTPEVFRNGLQFYISENKLGSTNANVLFSCLEKALVGDNVYDYLSDQYLNEILTSWDDLTGLPLVTAIRNYKTGQVHLKQEQFLYSKMQVETSHVWTIPISYAFDAKKHYHFNKTTANTWMTHREMEIPHAPKQGWIILNKYVTSYYRVDYDETNWMRLSEFLDSDEFETIPAVNRAQLIDDAFNLAKSGALNYEVPFNITRYLKREKDYIPWYTFFTNLKFIKEKIFSYQEYEACKKYIGSLYQNLYNHIGLDINYSDPHIDKLHREVLSIWMCSAGDERCTNKASEAFKNWMEGQNDIHPDLQTAFFCGAVAQGGDKEFDFLWKKYRSTPTYHENLKRRFISGMGCTLKEDLMEMYVKEAVNDKGMFEKHHKITVFESLYSQSYDGLKFVLKHLAEEDFRSSLKGDIDRILMGITNYIASDQLYFEFENVTTYIGKNTTFSSIIDSNIRWTRRYMDGLKKQCVKNRTNQNFSNATIFLIFYVMTLLF